MFVMAFLNSGSKNFGINLSAIPSIANLLGNVKRKASSLREILHTFAKPHTPLDVGINV